MARQFFRHEPVGQEKVWHIAHFIFLCVGQRADKVKIVISAVFQCMEGVQNPLVTLQGEHASEEQDDFFSDGAGGSDGLHGIKGGGIGAKIEQMQFFLVCVKFLQKVVAVTAGVAEKGVRMFERIGV